MKNNLLISIIDDDDISKFAIKIRLKEAGITGDIISFNDGEEALDFFLENISDSHKLPDIVFLDINMPIMDGFQFMEEFVKLEPKVTKHIPIYMISSSTNPCDIVRAKTISAITDYIVKPVTSEQLSAVFSSLGNTLTK